MRKNAIKAKMAKGEKIVNGWLAIPSSYSAEVMSHQGFDSVTVDMQHGAVDYQAAVGMMQAISTTDATPLVRVPWNEPGLMMKVLDAGAYGIICPMINTKVEAEAFVSACRYPPRGFRSNGPNRALLYGGADYVANANTEILLFAMIETKTALENLDGILSVTGLDGTYIGPTDLSFSFGKPLTLDPTDAEVLAAMEVIRKKTEAKGLIAGSHTDSAKTALKRFAEGYQFCTILNDARLMANAAAAQVKEAKGQAAPAASKTY